MHIIFGLLWFNIVPFALEIPKINHYSLVNENKSLDKGIVYKRYKDGPLVIMGHSGTGPAAVFNDIPILNENDVINLYYPKKKETYCVNSKFLVNKKTIISLENSNQNLYLITCDLNDYNKQWIILAKKCKKDEKSFFF